MSGRQKITLQSNWGGVLDLWQNVIGEPGNRKNCDVSKVKLKNFRNFQVLILNFRIILQPENVGKINLDKTF